MSTRREFLRQTSAASIMAATSQLSYSNNNTPVKRTARTPGIVQTIQGPLDASKLGFTLPHEHILASSAGFWRTWPEYFGGKTEFVNKVVDKLKAAREAGVDTIVDVTPADVGRDIRLIEEVSRKSGMQIIACTGHWLYPSMFMAARTVEELTEFFILEIDRGIEGTGIKPGVIKVAADQEGITPFIDKALRAAARASKATGVPVTTHTNTAVRTGGKQADIFEEESLNPHMVCLGHCDDTDDLLYLTGLAERGYTLGMDHITWGTSAAKAANADTLSWQQRAQSIKKLIDAGFGDKIFLSNDWYFDLSMAGTGFMAAKDNTNPDGILFNNRKTIPFLKKIGVTDQKIDTITVENPKRFFGGTPT